MCGEGTNTPAKLMVGIKWTANWKLRDRTWHMLIGNVLHHSSYVHIFPNIICWNMRKDTCHYVSGSVLSVRDYVEQLSAHLNLEIQ